MTREAPSALAKISIANLIDVAQPLHPEIFSRDVADALKVSYRGKEINARFAIGGIFTGSAADYANRSRQGGVEAGWNYVKKGNETIINFYSDRKTENGGQQPRPVSKTASSEILPQTGGGAQGMTNPWGLPTELPADYHETR